MKDEPIITYPEPAPGELKLSRAVNLQALYEESQSENIKGAAYKTVATFAGLTRRKLWLKDGNAARTDGHEIIAPFSHEYFYQIVEHELSHILFQSDGNAKKTFIEVFLAKMDTSLKKANTLGIAGLGGLMEPLTEFLSTIIGVLEDIRVESLWAMLYPGSFALLQECHKLEMKKWVERAHMSLEVYFIVTAVGIEPPQGRYSRYRPMLLDALNKVRRRSFGATLAVAKWLVQQLVSEALRAMKGLPPPPPSQGQGGAGKAAEKPKDGEPPSGDSGQGSAQDKTGSSPGMAGDGGSAGEEIGADGLGPDSTVGLVPMSTNASERIEGFKRLLHDKDTPSALYARSNDVKPGMYLQKGEQGRANELANYIANLNTTDKAALDTYLIGSEAAMNSIVEETRKALGQKMEVDDWITKNAFGKVNLTDVPPAQEAPTLAEDRDTIQKLRALFFRVLGRRKMELQESGSAIDVTSYIEAMVSKLPVPCFRIEDKGRGFKVVLLIDRSGSMRGNKTTQAERACRILAKALDFPFVEFHIWGFQSMNNSELDISRFDTRRKNFTFVSKHVRVAGNTPIHLALRVANRFMEVGTEARQIIVVTDGMPSLVSKKGFAYGTSTLTAFVREEVRHARRLNINVTGVIIGRDGSDSAMTQMFGPMTNWKRMSEKNFGDELVRLVTTSFVRYLRSG